MVGMRGTDISNIFDLDICVNALYTGFSWLYTCVEFAYAYDYKVTYFWFLSNIYDESFDFFFLTYWYFNLSTSSLQLFWSVLLDFYTNSNLLKFVVTDEWLRSFLSTRETTLFVLHHPELIFVRSQIINNFFINFLSDTNISIYEYLESESYITPILLFPQLIFIVYVVLVGTSFYFSFYMSFSKEENTTDADFLSNSMLVESEKEIGSSDDLLMTVLVFLYVFCWYFYIHFYTLCTNFPEISLVFFLMPIMYYVILNTPTLLLYDFGIFFVSYLRGVAPSSVLSLELMYDYVAVIAFYVRVLVQGVRLILMFFTYAGMHDVILYYGYDQTLLIGNESIWEEISNINLSVNSLTYFFVFILPGHVLYWLYELFHTFFVVTGQFVAYFAMIFWLFLFLFTFFVVERQENYFNEKRKQRQKTFKKIRDLNNGG